MEMRGGRSGTVTAARPSTAATAAAAPRRTRTTTTPAPPRACTPTTPPRSTETGRFIWKCEKYLQTLKNI